jgi:hypothetical protein
MLLLFLPTFGTQADTLAYEEHYLGSAAAASVSMPERGSSMQSVEQDFGSPNDVFPAVGSPPITRWRYPEFTVYFEGSHVIHPVVNRDKAAQ